MSNSLPDYAQRLDALHRALANDFVAIVAQLPLVGGERVLDAGCGDGFFTRLLAARLGAGRVEALDSSPAYLDLARSRLSDPIAAGRVALVEGDVNRLPFDAASLDVVWSAHSMQSYDDVPAVLREFRRVLRPGGLLAVLESDAMHSIMLPWPPRLELAVREAERRALGDADDRMGAYFPRYASRLFRAAGFVEFAERHAFIYRPGPLDNELANYVRRYSEDLLTRTRPRLSAELLPILEDIAAAYGAASPSQCDQYFASLQVLITALAPGPADR